MGKIYVQCVYVVLTTSTTGLRPSALSLQPNPETTPGEFLSGLTLCTLLALLLENTDHDLTNVSNGCG